MVTQRPQSNFEIMINMIKPRFIKQCTVVLCILLGVCSTSLGQDRKVADSLIQIYESGTYQGDQLELLEMITQYETQSDSMLAYADILLERAKAEDNSTYIFSGYLQRGNALSMAGDFDAALEAYFESIEVATESEMLLDAGKAKISVANLYAEMGNFANANIYYEDGISILRETDDQISLASALLNFGQTAFDEGNYDEALEYYQESGELFEQLDYPIGTAYNLGNIGMVYAEQGKDDLAESNINDAISILEELEDYYGISVYLTYMSEIYQRKDDFTTAASYAHRSLELARSSGLNNEISDANLNLSSLYEWRGDSVTAYRYYKDHIVYRDSVRNLEVIEQMADERTDFEVSQKQFELDLVEQKRKNERIVNYATGGVLIFIAILAYVLYRRFLFAKKTKQIIEQEKDRSDQLLLNILPQETADELKSEGKVKARKYDPVTVFFSDFKGFTSYSEGLSPEDLVETVGYYFSKFDSIVEKYGLEKIKTIGDAYMCVGGIHDNSEDHAERMIKAAMEIRDFVEETRKDDQAADKTFDIRIGINTGPVVAGVVGSKKFAYDIWGDTVNVAARMESMSEPGMINISEQTYKLIKDKWPCDYRGEFEVKNRGMMKMYFVNSA